MFCQSGSLMSPDGSFDSLGLASGGSWRQIQVGLDRLEAGPATAEPMFLPADQAEGNQVAFPGVPVIAVDGDDFHHNDRALTGLVIDQVLVVRVDDPAGRGTKHHLKVSRAARLASAVGINESG